MKCKIPLERRQPEAGTSAASAAVPGKKEIMERITEKDEFAKKEQQTEIASSKTRDLIQKPRTQNITMKKFVWWYFKISLQQKIPHWQIYLENKVIMSIRRILQVKRHQDIFLSLPDLDQNSFLWICGRANILCNLLIKRKLSTTGIGSNWEGRRLKSLTLFRKPANDGKLWLVSLQKYMTRVADNDMIIVPEKLIRISTVNKRSSRIPWRNFIAQNATDLADKVIIQKFGKFGRKLKTPSITSFATRIWLCMISLSKVSREKVPLEAKPVLRGICRLCEADFRDHLFASRLQYRVSSLHMFVSCSYSCTVLQISYFLVSDIYIYTRVSLPWMCAPYFYAIFLCHYLYMFLRDTSFILTNKPQLVAFTGQSVPPMNRQMLLTKHNCLRNAKSTDVVQKGWITCTLVGHGWVSLPSAVQVIPQSVGKNQILQWQKSFFMCERHQNAR